MPKIKMVVAIDNNYGIGFENQLLCRLPADLKHFKELTLNNIIVMGRKTYESIGRPLPSRTNVVLSSGLAAIDGVFIYQNLDSVFEAYKHSETLFVIGGESLFKALLPFTDSIYLTKIEGSFKADTFFPVLDESWLWEEIGRHEKDEANPYSMVFYKIMKKGST